MSDQLSFCLLGLYIPNRTSCVDAGSAYNGRVGLVPVERGQWGAELGRRVLIHTLTQNSQ